MKKLCFHTGASVLITDIDATINKLNEAVDTFIAQKDEIEVLWVADENIDQAFDGPLGSAALKSQFNEIVKKFESSQVGRFIPSATDDELADIASSCDAYYGDNGFLMGLFINLGKPVMKMDL